MNHQETVPPPVEASKNAAACAPQIPTATGNPIQAAIDLARSIQDRAMALQSPQEKKQQAELERLLKNPKDKATLTEITDQAFRSDRAPRSVDQLIHILDVQGIPRFFSRLDRALMKGFQAFGSFLPGVAMPFIEDKMREETANVILPAEREILSGHLIARTKEGVRMNVNYLGEALLGEEEASRRHQRYIEALHMPEVEVISVKISTVYSQIFALGREHAIQNMCDRMETLYQVAAAETFTRPDGTEVPKFVYLDMEEYRDMGITEELFLRTLDRPGMEQVRAGVALQAYLPDSYRTQKRINTWAKKRVAAGGAPVTIRLVKGANLEMERVEASIMGWPQAPYRSKFEVDANYKRMLHEGLQPGTIEAVHLGIASHNLFDLSYGLVQAASQNALDKVQFEMLEGMANHQRRALFEVAGDMLLYAPATRQEDFIYAIGYLVRRLDENTGPDNFLRHAFHLHVDSDEWTLLEKDFAACFDAIEDLSDAPRRMQDRTAEPGEPAPVPSLETPFRNEPDTDFALPQNLAWAESVVARWKSLRDENAADIPLVIAGKEIREDRSIRDALDPSRPGTVVGRYRQANNEDIEAALSCAVEDPAGWRTLDVDARATIMGRVAHEIRRGRGDLMGCAIADGGKTLAESDPEVSEAVDFVDFYMRSASELHAIEGMSARGKGVVVVVPPWNFPIAIPCGGVAAALAAGNTVILKPASDAVLIAYQLCQCFWRGGVPREALQLVSCSGAREGAELVADPRVNVVILTGGTDTALAMLERKPDMNLLAETGGKNATIVTAMADRDQAVKNILHSAFSHCGQKCSATSLLLLESEVYDDPHFREMLVDAAGSLQVGSAWDLKNRLGPMIKPPSGDLLNALGRLDPGESWALEPRQVDGNPSLYTPGIKWDVQPGSYSHMTEFFGPVLSVIRVANLQEAIEITNQTGFGLTSGLESLDDREQAVWKEGIRAGNLYINRSTTGAIVLRQPFGGMGKSAFGPGIKAGGPNYVAQLMDYEETAPPPGDANVAADLIGGFRAGLEALLDHGTNCMEPDQIRRVLTAVDCYAHVMVTEFGKEHDHFLLLGEDNIRRYLPVPALRIRVHAEDGLFDLLARVAAARIAGCRITVSCPPGFTSNALQLLKSLVGHWGDGIQFVEESDEELASLVRDGYIERVRYAAPGRVPLPVREAARFKGAFLADTPVLAEGRIELLWVFREQSVASRYHRYGNLLDRVDEERAPVL